MGRGRHIDSSADPQNILAIWNKLHELDQVLTSAQGTISSQQQTIEGLNSQLAAANQQIQQALIAAGKSTPANPTAPPGAPGGGGSGGGSGDAHPNHLALIEQAKTDLTTEGEDLSGPCGAFKIVRRAVQYIAPSDPGVGLLDKPSGNNCSGYAVDIVCYNDGVIYDVLVDGGGANNPVWNFAGTVDPSRYRPPF